MVGVPLAWPATRGVAKGGEGVMGKYGIWEHEKFYAPGARCLSYPIAYNPLFLLQILAECTVLAATLPGTEDGELTAVISSQ